MTLNWKNLAISGLFLTASALWIAPASAHGGGFHGGGGGGGFHGGGGGFHGGGGGFYGGGRGYQGGRYQPSPGAYRSGGFTPNTPQQSFTQQSSSKGLTNAAKPSSPNTSKFVQTPASIPAQNSSKVGTPYQSKLPTTPVLGNNLSSGSPSTALKPNSGVFQPLPKLPSQFPIPVASNAGASPAKLPKIPKKPYGPMPGGNSSNPAPGGGNSPTPSGGGGGGSPTPSGGGNSPTPSGGGSPTPSGGGNGPSGQPVFPGGGYGYGMNGIGLIGLFSGYGGGYGGGGYGGGGYSGGPVNAGYADAGPVNGGAVNAGFADNGIANNPNAIANGASPIANGPNAVDTTPVTAPSAPSVPSPPSAATTDLQLVDARLVSPGDIKTGPTYRIWVKNDSAVAVNEPTEVGVVVSARQQPTSSDPQALATIQTLAAGETGSVDVTLPATVNQSLASTGGQSAPRRFLLAAVDPRNRIADVNRENNVGIVERSKIPGIDVSPVPGPQTPGAATGAAEVVVK